MRWTSTSYGSAILASAIASLATAAANAAPGALIITGTRTEGGVASPLIKALDLRTGFSRLTYRMGESEAQEGFDGMGWVAANGITNSIDLPALIADARSRAWLDRTGWRETQAPGTRRRIVPSGGSPLTLTFGADRHVKRAVIDTDDGHLTITFKDWRRLGPFSYPFRQETVDDTGQQVVIAADKIDVRPGLGGGRLDRPASRSHAELTGKAPATVPMTLFGSSKSHILVHGTIDGIAAPLIFDTGAANYVTADAAPKYSLHPTGGINLGGVGESSTTAGYATVGRIALGNAALRNETIVVGPSPFGPSNGKPAEVDGFTGYEFLAEFITTIDYPGSTMSFAPMSALSHPSGVKIRFYSDGHSIYVPVNIEGRTALVRLDTGSADTVTIFPDYARKFGISSSAPVNVGGGGVGGTVKEQAGTVANLSLGGLTFRQLPVHLSQNKTGAFVSRSLAGNVGAGILQCYRLTFDYPGRTIWFDPRPTLPNCGHGAKVTAAGR
jgi:hypothetical protein